MTWILLTAAATLGLLVADFWDSKTGARVLKPLASAGFVSLAWSGNAIDTPYGTAILAGLALSFVGDVCLLSARKRWFLAGLVAFALAHVGYVVAFAQFQPPLSWVAIYGAGLLVPAVMVHRWLIPHVDAAMRLPVRAYMAIITIMLATATAAVVTSAPITVVIGAALFYLSDLSVARDRFVTPAFSNRLWGLPLYYAAQLILASTC
jgi:uncharacterized membrane protein YhhN